VSQQPSSGVTGASEPDHTRREPFFSVANQIGFNLIRWSVKACSVPYFRLSVSGAEHLPHGPFIIAPNHASLLDPVMLQAAISPRLVFMMTDEWYDLPLLKPLFQFFRAIRVQDGGGNRAALAQATIALLRGLPVAIFPEGRISQTGSLNPFNAGVTLLALRVGVPIVPASISGTAAALPRGARFPRPHKVSVRIGEPLRLSIPGHVRGRDRREHVARWTDELRRRIEALLP